MDFYVQKPSLSGDESVRTSLSGASDPAVLTVVRKRHFPYVFRMDEEANEMLLAAGADHQEDSWNDGGKESYNEDNEERFELDSATETAGIRTGPADEADHSNSIENKPRSISLHNPQMGQKRKRESSQNDTDSTAKSGDEILIEYVLKRIAEKSPVNWHYVASRIGLSVQDTVNRWNEVKEEFMPFIGDIAITSFQTKQNENNFLRTYVKNRYSVGGAVRLGYIAAKLNCSVYTARERLINLFPNVSTDPRWCLVVNEWFSTEEEEKIHTMIAQRRAMNLPLNEAAMAKTIGCSTSEFKHWCECNIYHSRNMTPYVPKKRRSKEEMLVATSSRNSCHTVLPQLSSLLTTTSDTDVYDTIDVCVAFARVLFTHRADRKYTSIRNASLHDTTIWNTHLSGRPRVVYECLRASPAAQKLGTIGSDCVVALQFVVTAVELSVVVDNIMSVPCAVPAAPTTNTINTINTTGITLLNIELSQTQPTLSRVEVFTRTKDYMRYIKRNKSSVDWVYLSDRLLLSISETKLYWYHLLRDMVVKAIVCATKESCTVSAITTTGDTTTQVVNSACEPAPAGNGHTNSNCVSVPIDANVMNRAISTDDIIRSYMRNVDSTHKPDWKYLARVVGMGPNDVKLRWWAMHNDTIHNMSDKVVPNVATKPERVMFSTTENDSNVHNTLVSTPAIEALRGGNSVFSTDVHMNRQAGHTMVRGDCVVPYSRSAVRATATAPPPVVIPHFAHPDVTDDVVILPPPRVEHVVVDLTDDD